MTADEEGRWMGGATTEPPSVARWRTDRTELDPARPVKLIVCVHVAPGAVRHGLPGTVAEMDYLDACEAALLADPAFRDATLVMVVTVNGERSWIWYTGPDTAWVDGWWAGFRDRWCQDRTGELLCEPEPDWYTYFAWMTLQATGHLPGEPPRTGQWRDPLMS